MSACSRSFSSRTVVSSLGEEGAALLTASGLGAAEQAQDGLDDAGPVGAEPACDLGCDPVTLADQAKQ